MSDITSFNTRFDSAIGPVDAYDRTHRCSLFSVMPDWFQELMQKESVLELLKLSEEDFEKKYTPNVTLKRLRTNFWIQYNNVVDKLLNTTTKSYPSFNFSFVYLGICSKNYFKERILDSDVGIAYLIRVPIDYTLVLQEALDTGVNRLREILNFPLYKKRYTRDGDPITDEAGNVEVEPDYKASELLLKTVAMLDLRVKGAIPQKLNIEGYFQKKSINVNANITKNYSNGVELDNKLMSIEDLDKKLETLTYETSRVMDYPTLNMNENNFVNRQLLKDTDIILDK